MNLFKKLLPDVVVIVLFALISFAYFYPAVNEGRILAQHDAVAGIGSGREMSEYLEKTGERTRWTNSIFGGMPTYQMSPSYDSTDTLGWIQQVYHLFLPTYVWYVFVMLLGAVLCYLCLPKTLIMNNMNLFKKLLPDVVVIVLFALISFAYFYPAVNEGRILAQHDAVAGIGSGREMSEYLEKTGERTRWTNSIFGGMPTYQMSPSYDSTDTLGWIQQVYHLFLPAYVWYVFVMLLGFYILLRAFDFKVWMSALGAIIWAFSSYFFIIIAAGHIWKFVALAYIPPTIAGMVLAYRGKLLAGGIVTALFVALQIVANHPQMSYYFLFVMLFMAIAYGVMAWRERKMPQFLKASVILVIAGLLGVCVNLSNLYHTYEYSKETMRGKSELVKENSANQTNSGLERSYITQWS